MFKIYGDNGYGWKLKEIVGAQIVMVPMSVPVANADRMFKTFMFTLTGVFVAVFVLLNIMLSGLIINRLGEMATIAEEISRGNFEIGEFNEGGSDEVAHLSSSFNRMRRSLIKAMDFFNKQPG
jgi:HAMP domain-containing protein